MSHKHKTILRTRLLKLAHIALVTLVFALVWIKAYAPLLAQPVLYAEIAAVVALFAFLDTLLLRVYDAFLISQSRISELVGSQFLSALLTDLFLYVVSALLLHRLPPVLPMLAGLFVQGLIAVVWTYAVHQWFFRFGALQPSAVIYDDEQTARTFIREDSLRRRYDLVHTLHVSELDADMACLADVEVVFLTDVPSRCRDPILKYCVEQDIEVYVIPRIGDLIMSGAGKTHMFHFPMLRVGRYHPRPEYLIAKRLMDVITALLALIVLSPVMLVTAVLIRRYDHGPVLYRQTRLTRGGKPFSLLKFRSMRTDAERDGVARLSSGRADPRVTPIGRVIRKYRIDELPQLLNILKGDLSVVGPRPERPEIAAQYEQKLPEFRLRLQAKAGLTGYAQVYGKYNTDPYHKLQMDLMYIASPSLLEDLRICFATVKVLFQSESTEGVAADMTNADAASAQPAETRETTQV